MECSYILKYDFKTKILDSVNWKSELETHETMY